MRGYTYLQGMEVEGVATSAEAPPVSPPAPPVPGA
jgi:hypothetical protein